MCDKNIHDDSALQQRLDELNEERERLKASADELRRDLRRIEDQQQDLGAESHRLLVESHTGEQVWVQSYDGNARGKLIEVWRNMAAIEFGAGHVQTVPLSSVCIDEPPPAPMDGLDPRSGVPN